MKATGRARRPLVAPAHAATLSATAGMRIGGSAYELRVVTASSRLAGHVVMRRKAAGRPRIRAVHPLESALARCRSQIPAAAPISPRAPFANPTPGVGGSAGAPDHVAIRGVWVATASASDRASIAVSVAADAATPAGRSPAGTLARLGDGTAGSAAVRGPNLWPLDPILRPTSRRRSLCRPPPS